MITKICVTGGIGSGKSVVCRICALKGVPVYDCDSRAKDLMQTDPELRAFLIGLVGPEVFDCDGLLNRRLLSDAIFGNERLRIEVEREVHAAVRRDINAWLDLLEQGCADGLPPKAAVIETAIPRKAFIDKMVDTIWVVCAPRQTRVERVMARSALSREQVYSRMATQDTEFLRLPTDKTIYISNTGSDPLLPQVHSLLKPYLGVQ